MYPDFLATPELVLECLRQDNLITYRNAERQRLVQQATGLQPTRLSARFSTVIARVSRSYTRLQQKPKLTSMPAATR